MVRSTGSASAILTFALSWVAARFALPNEPAIHVADLARARQTKTAVDRLCNKSRCIACYTYLGDPLHVVVRTCAEKND